MGKKRASLTLLVIMALMSTLLAACGGSNNESGTKANQTEKSAEGSNTSDAGKKEDVTLTAWIMPNSPKPEEEFMELVKPYLEQNPNVKIKATVLDWGSAWTKITTAATSGEGPDLLQLGTTWVPAIAAMNGIEDLTSRIADVGGEESYLPASWNTTKIDGKPEVYGVPWFVDARAMFYRTDAFEKAGVDPKTAFKDWDSLKEAMKKLNGVEIAGKKMAAFGLSGKNDWNVPHNIFPWVWAAGGKIYTDGNKEAAFNSAEALKGVMYYTGLAHEGLVDKTSLEKNSAQVESDFAEGKSAIIVSGAYMVKNLNTPADKGGMGDKEAAKNFAVAPLPAGPAEQSTFIGGSNLTIFKGSKNKDAAWDVIKYLSTDEAQLNYSKFTGNLPGKKSVIDSLGADPNFASFVEATKYGKSYPSIPQWGPTETALVKYFGNIWDIVAGVSGTYSEASVQEQLNAAAKEVNAILNQ
ncbi:sugar ABC transporter substrate-binding protein [Paenibacillus sp. NEAU-GSW1]|uniref:sugar ABC transporter substrate-binding protein n=1 Tax=Paenibacillus sp. NEAU-GSW1 TaxID=2682486 RepID=UPI0012E2E4D4|nr:sugar ABC transporter substrate-binding protein [Paenibacillus sp. NEAU-GSW1]MUT64863.1 extracellular solute-binding protein [Paenibacillus sp. NEAU-GSW1]